MDEATSFIIYICDLLKMDDNVYYEFIDEEMMQIYAGKSVKACYDIEEDCVFIIDKDTYDYEDYYEICHELRHVYQFRNNKDYYFKDYRDDMDEHEYNCNVAEIDANAFAAIAMAIAFEKVTKRTYKNDIEAQALYDKRLKELQEEYEVYF